MGRPRKSKADIAHISVAVSSELRHKIEMEADVKDQSISDVVRPVLEKGFNTKPIITVMADMKIMADRSKVGSTTDINSALSKVKAEAENIKREAEGTLNVSLAKANAAAEKSIIAADELLNKAKADTEASLALVEKHYEEDLEDIQRLWDNSPEKALLEALKACGIVNPEGTALTVGNGLTTKRRQEYSDILARKYLAPSGIICIENDYGGFGIMEGASSLLLETLLKFRYRDNLAGALSEAVQLHNITVSPEWQDCYMLLLRKETGLEELTIEDIWACVGWQGYGIDKSYEAGGNCLNLSEELVLSSLRRMSREFRNSVLGSRI